MPSEMLDDTLMEVRASCEDVLKRYGNVELPSSLDPFVTLGRTGGNITIRSVPGKILRYANVRATMQGLINVLVIGALDCEAEAEIEQIGKGVVGICNVQAAA